MMHFEYAWRWFGPTDPISLEAIAQTGVTNIVTALHHIPAGEVWTVNEIKKIKEEINQAGLTWLVVESVPVHEDIKRRDGNYQKYIDNYKKTIQNLGKQGIKTICYNFIPVLGWVRTDLKYKLPDGTFALHYNETELAAFDIFILKRSNAQEDYSDQTHRQAEIYFSELNSDDISQLTDNILAGLPGSDAGYTLSEFRQMLNAYEGISANDMRNHLSQFLQEVIPVAANAEVKMAIHPDDPPFTLFGLPRVVSTEDDLSFILEAVDSFYNGLTFCTGSLGAGVDNNLFEIISKFGHRIHFVHLRNIITGKNRSFTESDHLRGDVDMAAIMHALIQEQYHRKNDDVTDINIPIRPDHGHVTLHDLNQNTLPGYPYIGRLRGLAELRGLETGIRSNFSLPTS